MTITRVLEIQDKSHMNQIDPRDVKCSIEPRRINAEKQ